MIEDFDKARQELLIHYLNMGHNINAIVNISSRKRNHVEDFDAIDEMLKDMTAAVKLMRDKY